jgi:hypothetical protein
VVKHVLNEIKYSVIYYAHHHQAGLSLPIPTEIPVLLGLVLQHEENLQGLNQKLASKVRPQLPNPFSNKKSN